MVDFNRLFCVIPASCLKATRLVSRFGRTCSSSRFIHVLSRREQCMLMHPSNSSKLNTNRLHMEVH